MYRKYRTFGANAIPNIGENSKQSVNPGENINVAYKARQSHDTQNQTSSLKETEKSRCYF